MMDSRVWAVLDVSAEWKYGKSGGSDTTQATWPVAVNYSAALFYANAFHSNVSNQTDFFFKKIIIPLV